MDDRNIANYLAVVTRHDGCWVATVCGIPGAQTWGESIEQLHLHVREIIILRTGRPVAELNDLWAFSITYRLYDEERAQLHALGGAHFEESAPAMARLAAQCCVPWDQVKEQPLWRRLEY